MECLAYPKIYDNLKETGTSNTFFKVLPITELELIIRRQIVLQSNRTSDWGNYHIRARLMNYYTLSL